MLLNHMYRAGAKLRMWHQSSIVVCVKLKLKPKVQSTGNSRSGLLGERVSAPKIRGDLHLLKMCGLEESEASAKEQENGSGTGASPSLR